MVATPNYNYISPTEYLQGEENSPIKYEYRDGEVYAMAGASNTHVIITGNVFAILRNHLRGSGCQAYISDTKAHIESINTYYYPDVIVSCNQKDKAFHNFLRYPCLIIEVLSPTTEAFDRGDKFADYQMLETLQEYVLINTKKPRVECFRRNEEGLWILQSYIGEQTSFQLQTINFTGTMTELYEDVNFLPLSQQRES